MSTVTCQQEILEDSTTFILFSLWVALEKGENGCAVIANRQSEMRVVRLGGEIWKREEVTRLLGIFMANVSWQGLYTVFLLCTSGSTFLPVLRGIVCIAHELQPFLLGLWQPQPTR